MRNRNDKTEAKPKGAVKDAIVGYLAIVLTFVSFLLILWIIMIIVRLLVG